MLKWLMKRNKKRTAKITFPQLGNECILTIRSGFREDSLVLMENAPKKINLEKGVYSVDLSGDGICDVHKVFCVSESQLGKKVEIEIPVLLVENKEAEYKECIFLYSDELEDKLYNIENLKEMDKTIFDTPSFSQAKKMHQFATNKEKLEYIKNVVEKCEFGRLDCESFSFPVVCFSENTDYLQAPLNEILDRFRQSGKLNLFYHAQIHGNETASGEGALVILKKLSGEFGAKLLKKMNIVVVPCVNLRGNTEQIRTFGSIDLNRDFLTAETKIVQDLHKIFYRLSPEVLIDGHTFTRANSFKGENIKKALFDIRMSSCNTLNMEQCLIVLGEELVDATLEECRNKGFRCGYYGTAVNANSSRAYYALSPCCSILVETEGTRTAKYHLRRNVWGQNLAITTLLEKLYIKSDFIKELINEERAKINNFEGMFREKFVAEHGRSRQKKYVTKVTNYDFYANIVKENDEIPFYIYDIAKKTIHTKKEYIIEEHNISEDELKFFEEVHGIQWNIRKLENGEKVYVIPGNQPQIQVFLTLLSKGIFPSESNA